MRHQGVKVALSPSGATHANRISWKEAEKTSNRQSRVQVKDTEKHDEKRSNLDITQMRNNMQDGRKEKVSAGQILRNLNK